MNEVSAAKARVVVLVSGSGSNLQSIIDACKTGEIDAVIAAVIANRPACRGLERAREAGIPALAIDHKAFDSRESFDEQLALAIDEYKPDLVVLAGFMRILTPGFVGHYRGRLLNIHPSLLPKYPGLDTHQRALDAGDASAGATVHFVTEELDGGPAVIQAAVSIESGDSAETLAARVLKREHKIYPLAIRWFCERRLTLKGDEALLDHQVLPKTGVIYSETSAVEG